ncbi:MAG: rhodanese-like domain-containing protein [Flavobacteriaceae bacterium]|nr:rhodanese-like domain-containing protein [Flavobacteriaceae bacterium]
MKNIKSYFILLFMAAVVFSGFKSIQQQDVDPTSEFGKLVAYLEANGNFINSDMAPAIITPEEIKDNLKNDKYLVLDIRSDSWFSYGHIKNAKNVEGPKLLEYFQNEIDPTAYDKITIVCYSGQSAAYYTSLLRLYGYNNVYNLKWGMSSWADDFAANIWTKNTANDYSDKLETTANPMPEKGNVPTINTGKTEAKDILQQRIVEAFAKPYKEFVVNPDVAVENPSDYYVVNYMNEEQYNTGHVKGAVLYQPNKSLSSTEDLYTLPTDKKVLVNCLTGQHAAYVVAYLQVLGYDVANLAYGANGYMNKTLVEKGWNGFSKDEIKNFPVVE